MAKQNQESTKPKEKSTNQTANLGAMTATAVAKLYGITRQAVTLWCNSGCPKNDDDATYNLAAVVQWREAWLIDSLQRKEAVDEPSMERLRLAKAQREEIALERDRGKLISREDVHVSLGRLAVILRGMGETIGRQYGPEAQVIIDEALDDFVSETERTFTDRPE